MSQEDEIALLAQLPLLSELEVEVLRVVAFSAEHLTLKPGDVLCKKGSRSDAGYLVVAGSLGLYRGGATGEPDTILHKGGLFGEMAMLTGTEYPATAVAVEDVTLLRIQRGLFQRVLREYPGAAARLRSALEKRLRHFTARLNDIFQEEPGR